MDPIGLGVSTITGLLMPLGDAPGLPLGTKLTSSMTTSSMIIFLLIFSAKIQNLNNYRLVWFLVQKPLVLLVLSEVVLGVLI